MTGNLGPHGFGAMYYPQRVHTCARNKYVGIGRAHHSQPAANMFGPRDVELGQNTGSGQISAPASIISTRSNNFNRRRAETVPHPAISFILSLPTPRPDAQLRQPRLAVDLLPPNVPAVSAFTVARTPPHLPFTAEQIERHRSRTSPPPSVLQPPAGEHVLPSPSSPPLSLYLALVTQDWIQVDNLTPLPIY